MTILYTRKAEILINNPSSIELLQSHIDDAYRIPLVLKSWVNKLISKLDKYNSTVYTDEENKALNEVKEISYESYTDSNET